MERGFWDILPRPFFALAPMADVTDAPFRAVIAARGKPDVMFTEFVSADGLFLGGREKLVKDLQFSPAERPIVAQFFTARPEMMEKAALLARELGFDGVDVNMGCPDRGVERQGAGAALIKNPARAREIIRAAREGGGGLPVSVKTRIGYAKDELTEWLPELLAEEPAAVTIHARTRQEMSKVPAHWGAVAQAVEIRNKMAVPTLIIGNGDSSNLVDARKRAEETGADGIMLGRAIFGNPWLFARDIEKKSLPLRVVLETLIEHVELFDRYLGGVNPVRSRARAHAPEGLGWATSNGVKSFAVMKKHFKAYLSGIEGTKELRMRLMEAKNAIDAEGQIVDFLASLPHTKNLSILEP